MRVTARRGLAALRREDGITIVVALALLTIGLAVGAAALAETLSSRSHANLDARQRRALQAADYGVQAVLYRANQLNLDSLDLTGGTGVLGKLADCIVPKVNSEGVVIEWETSTPSSGGVCPSFKESSPKGKEKAPEWMEIGNHDYYQAVFIPDEKVPTGGSGVEFTEPKIISIGLDEIPTASGSSQRVYERVEANLAAVEPFKTVEANHDLTFKVSSATVFNGTARADHNVVFKGEGALLNTFTGTNVLGSGNKTIEEPSIEYGCEAKGVASAKEGFLPPSVTVTPEPGMLHHVTEKNSCSGEAYFSRYAVTISGSKADWSSPTGSVTCSSPTTGYEASNANGTQDAVFIENEKSLELTPGCDYVFCSLVTNGPITLPAGTSNASLPVRIFIDNPSSSRCSKFEEHTPKNKALKEPLPGEKVKAGNFAALQGIGGLVGGFNQTLSPTQVQIYLAGNGSNEGTAFSSSATSANAFFLYAPQSNVTMTAKSFSGTLSGYNVTIASTLYSQDLGLDNYPLSSTAGVFRVSGYTQCSLSNSAGEAVTGLGTTISADSSGC